MNILKLTLPSEEPNKIRINASAIVSYGVDASDGYTIIMTNTADGIFYIVKETPEQIDKILLDMGVKICP